MNAEQIRKEFEDLMTKINGGASAEAAASGAAAGTPPAVESKSADVLEAEAKEARVGGSALAKSLHTLARTSKSFRHLDSNKILDDPRGYLRQKKAGSDQYLVSDFELETMMQTLLEQKKADTEDVTDDRVRGKLVDAASKGMFGRQSEVVVKALDTGNGAALIRTDVEPLMYEGYLREFPAAEQIGTVKANGLVHNYDVRTAIPQAVTLNNIGDFGAAFSNSTFVRNTNSNIAIIAAPVAIGLKLALAVEQSGMTSFKLEGNDNLEVMGALTSIARKNQSLMLQGNFSQAGGTLDTEDGLYDNKAFDGLRTILKAAGTSITKAGGDTFRSLINRAVAQIRNSGGTERNLIILCSSGAEIAVNEEFFAAFYKINDSAPAGGVDTTPAANGIRTVGKYLSRMVSVPSDAQDAGTGYYTFGGNPTEDMYVADANGCKFAYLGSPTPTMLELPMGYNNQLSRVFVPFLMNGLVVHIAGFQRKIRIPKQTV